MKSGENTAWIELHIAVLLFGITAILGKLIELPAISIVWWRVMLTSISLLLFIRIPKLLKDIPPKELRAFILIGVLVALHWITFYGAIKLANASIALVCMATASFFTSLIEPLLLRYKVRTYELLLGLAIIPGMALVARAAPSEHMFGILVGLLSAALAALFGALNKKYIAQHNPFQVTLLEIGSATIFITAVLLVMGVSDNLPKMNPSLSDWIYLGVLALFCTTLAYVLSLRALRYISAFATALTINLEPVYGIILAWVLLREDQELGLGFYFGVLIILGAVMSYPFIHKKFYKKTPVE